MAHRSTFGTATTKSTEAPSEAEESERTAVISPLVDFLLIATATTLVLLLTSAVVV